MGILTRALDKIKKNENDAATSVAAPGAPDAKKRKRSAGPSTDTDSETSLFELPEFDIDIRLDQDLTDYAERSRQERYREAELDFDLSQPGNEELSFIETQVLRINPVKSFSHQIEVDLKRLAAEGYITPDDVGTVLSNTFRQLKRPILNNVMGKGATVLDNANLIMMTSALAGEGKTFSAINMAMSIALERDRRVLLIDADVNKPSHHKIFGLDLKQGLVDVLMRRVDDVSKVIYKTNIPSLSLMFSGSKTPHATELFASKNMEQFLEELSARYDDRIIIFDSAPLLLPTEASVLAAHMGQIVMVVEAEKTRHESVRKSLDMLSNSIVLLLLNKAREKEDYGSYGYSGKYEEQ